MIRKLGTSIGRAVLDGVGQVTSRLQERKSLPADLLESEDAYLAVFDAPDVIATDIAVTFEDNVLSVRVDRVRGFYDGYELVFPGRGLALAGEVPLPDGAAVDADEAEATLTRNGTLEVLLPKSQDGDDDTAPESDEQSVHSVEGDETEISTETPDTA